MFNSFATPWTPLSLGFPRQEYWSGLPFPSPGDLSHPGIDPTFPWLQVDSLPLSHWGLPVSLFTQGIFLIPLFLLNPKASSSAYSTCFVSYIYEHFTVPFVPPLLWSLPLALWLGEFFTSLLLPYISWHPHNSQDDTVTLWVSSSTTLLKVLSNTTVHMPHGENLCVRLLRHVL